MCHIICRVSLGGAGRLFAPPLKVLVPLKPQFMWLHIHSYICFHVAPFPPGFLLYVLFPPRPSFKPWPALTLSSAAVPGNPGGHGLCPCVSWPVRASRRPCLRETGRCPQIVEVISRRVLCPWDACQSLLSPEYWHVQLAGQIAEDLLQLAMTPLQNHCRGNVLGMKRLCYS